MLEITPGKEEEFRHLQRWMAGSEWLDRLIEASESRARGRCPGDSRRDNGRSPRRRARAVRAGCRRGQAGRWFRQASTG